MSDDFSTHIRPLQEEAAHDLPLNFSIAFTASKQVQSWIAEYTFIWAVSAWEGKKEGSSLDQLLLKHRVPIKRAKGQFHLSVPAPNMGILPIQYQIENALLIIRCDLLTAPHATAPTQVL